MNCMKLSVLALMLASVGCASAPVEVAEMPSSVDVRVEWGEFLKRHDLVWEKLPERFDHGAYLGNGLLGAMIYKDGPNRLRWEIGRSDVTEHRRDNNRLPIGGMVLETVGAIESGNIRLDLWNAEVRGALKTDKGVLAFRSFIHAGDLFLSVDLKTSEGEKAAKFTWNATPAVDAPNASFKDPPNPPSRSETDGDVLVCVQPRFAGGEFATAWTELASGASMRRLVLSVGDSFPGSTAKADAVASVRKAAEGDFATQVESHRDWWHGYYPKSFLSVPDTRVESFYWIQMYKLACATRSDRPVMDLLGPWYRHTGWPRIWWNLNIQICYLPVYAANHLEIGESLVRFLDAKRANFFRNGKEIWGFDDCATVPHTTDYEGLRGDGGRAPQRYINPGDFTWALHNYWLHYRYSMDESIVTDTKKHAFYPLLRGSVNLYLKLLTKGEDGKLHLPEMHSPEYGNTRDNNYNLSMLRWACTTLLDLNKRYNLNDPLAGQWENVLKNLTDYAKDDTGMRIGPAMAYDKSHRHWSHMIMMWPLYLMTWEQPENRDLMHKSVDHWLAVGGGKGINGWSRAAASSLYSSMGNGEEALLNLHRHLDDQRFVMPNAMYIEGAPVIECAFVAAKSLQDMLLQSWGGKIRIFPAVPMEWKDAVIHDMRAEGAFLVSAVRKDGKTQWVRIKSLAGEPCRVAPNIDGEPSVEVNGKTVHAKLVSEGVYEIPLTKGEEALLVPAGADVKPVIAPLTVDPAKCNFYGVKTKTQLVVSTPASAPRAVESTLPPALSKGKPATASSTWSKGYEPAKAFDGDTDSRWGAKPDARSGWLAVDLGQDTQIGQAVVMEIGFPRTEEFKLEYKDGETWKELAKGAAIGGVKLIEFAPVKARHVRLNILSASEVPTIEEFQIFAPGTVKADQLPKVAVQGAAVVESPEAAAARQARLKWFNEAKYGFFINWGLYSIPAGEWKGKPVGGIGEWIMHNAKIPVKEYELLARQFNPVKFNADEWAQLAVDAGMKYVVFDCKHHDGFALYHSAVSKYNCFDATPWKRDPFKELQEACTKRGLKLCFYYSQATDWHEKNGANNDWDFPPNAQKDFDQYLQEKSLPQIKELLTNYGPIGLIWFDVPSMMTPERSKKVHDLVRSVQPDVLINSRLGQGGLHDYRSMGDNEIPHSKLAGAWETAATINDTWGYKKDDHHWKPADDITFKLVDITSKGGNYLLNVGPDGDGFIPQPSQDILRTVGKWLKTNGEAVYGAGPTPFGDELGQPDPTKKDKKGRTAFHMSSDWRCTVKPFDWTWGKPGKLYISFFKWPGAKFELAGVKGKVVKACLLADAKTPLKFTQAGEKLTVALPEKALDPIATVLCLEVE